MTAPPVLAVLNQFPLGRTTAQIARQLGMEHDAAARGRLARELAQLSGERVVEIDARRRWRLRRVSSAPSAVVTGSGGAPDPGIDPTVLRAALARFARVPVDPGAGDEEEADDDGDDGAPPDHAALLRYYAAALRSDTRGEACEPVDRHGASHLLVTGAGTWWPDEGSAGHIVLTEDALPPTFREALFRRDPTGGVIAVGWPLAVLRRDGVPSIVPVGLLSATWAREGSTYVIEVPVDAVALNPAFVRFGRTQGGLSKHEMEERLTDGGSPLGIEEFAHRLRAMLATRAGERFDPADPVQEVDASRTSVRSALALFLPTEATFTARAAADLDAIARWPADRVAATALGTLLGMESGIASTFRPAVLEPVPLNAEQLEAARRGLVEPISAVTGPPGTGKSQVIVASVASVVATGGSVIVASRNHQALDAVEGRLGALAPGLDPIVRTLDPATSRDVDFDAVLRLLATTGGVAPPPPPTAALERLRTMDGTRADALDRAGREAATRTRLAEHIERRRAVGDEGTRTRPSGWRRWWTQLLARRTRRTPSGALDAGASAAALDAAIAADRAKLVALPTLPDGVDPAALSEAIAAGAAAALPTVLAARMHVPDPERVALDDAVAEGDLLPGSSLERGLAERIVDRRPIWLASVLGVPKRVPLEDGLFDLAIIDEAGQCDIASALPVLARARRAMVVGDPKQLSFIPGLSIARERNLMSASGLPVRGMGRYAQSRRTVFDLAARASEGGGTLLRRQFRSAPAIVDYISSAFYGGRLESGRDEAEFTAPPGMRPGLAWTHVAGTIAPAPGGGTANPSEADAIAGELARLRAEGYDGSIGIVAPFNAQARAIMAAVDATVPPDWQRARELRIGTVDAFQGQERDLIVFSPTVCERAPASMRTFVQRDWRRINVAISRARAVAHVMGDIEFARSGGIRSLARLAARATEPRARDATADTFDSEWERRLDAAMREFGLRPQPQYPIAGRRLDFALFRGDVKLDVEVDGRRWHTDADGQRKAGDVFRDAQLRALGWTVRRFWVDELDADMGACVERIERDLAGS